MTRIITIILVFFGTVTFGQNVRIDTLNLKKSEQFQELQSDKMNFPIIRTGNIKIDSLINSDLKNKFTSNEYPTASIDSTLIKWAGDQIIYLDFEVTYNQNGILSLSISTEGCGAYCTSWTDYYNYSIKNGQSLSVSDIIDTTGKFKELVFSQKNEQFNQQKKELKEMLLDKESGLDQDTYEVALEYYNGCNDSFELKDFVLDSESIEIIEDCYLPHVMQNLTPKIELKYKFSEINEYLKIKN